MQTYRADLHIHTCLSPCGELEMTPRAIVETAAEAGLNIIGICDHNAAANVAAVWRASRRHDLAVIPGLEVTSREEVHVLALFAHTDAAMAMQAHVWAHLSGENDERLFGQQVIVDEYDEPLSLCTRLLIGATDLTLSEVVDAIHERGGLAIAAHVDRERFGVVGQLGFVPPTVAWDGLEHSARTSGDAARRRYDGGGRWPLVCHSDAHRLSDIGQVWTEYALQRPSAGEIRMALQGQQGRRIVA